jgi:hypothetical protein
LSWSNAAAKARTIHLNNAALPSVRDVLVRKHGMIGVYQHCGEAHLHRYLAEYDFRYNRRTALDFTDEMRVDDRVGHRKASASRIDGLTKAITPRQKRVSSPTFETGGRGNG